MIAATVSRESAAEQAWDAVVVGAGPAGAFAALRLAQAGARTLLVERKTFPRDKVCGGCVSHRALALLDAAGLNEAVERAGAPTRSLRLYADGRRATLAIPRGLTIPRRDFDALLVEGAIAAGAAFLPQTTAVVGPVERDRRIVRFGESRRPETNCLASVVLLATGLGLTDIPAELARENEAPPGARIGIGATIETPDDGEESALRQADIEPGVIHMVVGPRGYVGLARAGRGRLMAAAAIDADLLAEARHPAAAAAMVLATAGRESWAEFMATTWRIAAWTGTPALTRRLRRPVAERIFVLGDAAGYVEPFTGEGIGWALAAGENVVVPALAARGGWSERIERRWLDQHARALERRRRFCRAMAAALRSRLMVGAAIRLLSVAPGVSAPAVWLWNRPLPVVESECL